MQRTRYQKTKQFDRRGAAAADEEREAYDSDKITTKMEEVEEEERGEKIAVPSP